MQPRTGIWLDLLLDIPYLIYDNSRVAETLPQEVLTKMHAPPKPDYPVIQPADLAHYDGFIFGVPTRYGSMPAQFKVCIYLPFLLLFIGLEPAFVGLLGCHRPPLATGQVARQGRWRVCLNWWPRWWPGGNCHRMPFDLLSPWYPLRAPWLCDCLWTVDEPL